MNIKLTDLLPSYQTCLFGLNVAALGGVIGGVFRGSSLSVSQGVATGAVVNITGATANYLSHTALNYLGLSNQKVRNRAISAAG